MAYTASWTAVVNCEGFTLQHYRLCWDYETTTAPSDPAGADACFSVSSGSTSQSVYGHRSAMEMGIRLFACDDGPCSDVYGDAGSETVTASGDDDDVETQAERWVLEDLSGYGDTSRAIGDPNADASAAMFYPAGFTYSGTLALWYSTSASTVRKLKYRRASSSGWQSFNNTSWTAETELAVQPGTSPAGSFDEPTHPWIMPLHHEESRAVRMFAHFGPEAPHSL